MRCGIVIFFGSGMLRSQDVSSSGRLTALVLVLQAMYVVHEPARGKMFVGGAWTGNYACKFFSRMDAGDGFQRKNHAARSVHSGVACDAIRHLVFPFDATLQAGPLS